MCLQTLCAYRRYANNQYANKFSPPKNKPSYCPGKFWEFVYFLNTLELTWISRFRFFWLFRSTELQAIKTCISRCVSKKVVKIIFVIGSKVKGIISFRKHTAKQDIAYILNINSNKLVIEIMKSIKHWAIFRRSAIIHDILLWVDFHNMYYMGLYILTK